MANTFKLKTKANVGVTTVGIYTAPAATTTVVIGITLANTSGSGVNVGVGITRAGTTEDVKLLKNAIENFKVKLVDGMEPNQRKMKLNLENSLMLITAIVPKVGYEKAAEIAKLAFKESLNLKEATLKLGYLNEDEFNETMNINSMI